jgi:hypothetical protein
MPIRSGAAQATQDEPLEMRWVTYGVYAGAAVFVAGFVYKWTHTKESIVLSLFGREEWVYAVGELLMRVGLAVMLLSGAARLILMLVT